MGFRTFSHLKVDEKVDFRIALNELSDVFPRCRAKAEAEGIQNEYEEEAKTYKSLMNSNRLNTAGFLAYMGVRAIDDQDGTVFLNMDPPAKTNWGL